MEMIDIIRSGDKRAIISAMIEPISKSVWSSERADREELNFDDAIKVLHPDEDFAMPVIRVEKFLDTMLDTDEFSLEVNEILYSLKKDDSDKVIELLKEEYGDEINENGYLCGGGYTYNHENDLSRDIVYHIFEYNADTYAFIQVHYGADARVGFGAMVCFKVNDADYFYNGMQITVYHGDNDYSVYQLDDISTYDKESQSWKHNETGEEINLYTSADGY